LFKPVLLHVRELDVKIEDDACEDKPHFSVCQAESKVSCYVRITNATQKVEPWTNLLPADAIPSAYRKWLEGVQLISIKCWIFHETLGVVTARILEVVC
jgi:hypothetical protein